jgi:diguanylate cyclase (GGDEF)-like protein
MTPRFAGAILAPGTSAPAATLRAVTSARHRPAAHGPLVREPRLLLRVIALCLAAVAVVTVAGEGNGLWLCVPLTLLAAACAPHTRSSWAAAGAVAIAALLTSLAHGEPLTGRPVFPVAVIACAAVLIVMRERLVRERDALRTYALTDPLTRIANRRSLLNRADYEIERHRRSRRSFALVMLDLDGFKGLNDRFGHPAGDELLRDVALALQRAMRGQDTVARFGGDEFCVLAPETDETGIDRLAGRIADAVGEVTVGVETVRASLGVALFPDEGEQPAELLEVADQRLLAVKRRHYASRPAKRRRAA